MDQVFPTDRLDFQFLRWIFEERSPTAVANVPKSKEHFQSDRLDALVVALVSELTQNTGDAYDILTFGPVTLRFRRQVYTGAFFWNELMNGMDGHIDAVREKGRSVGVELFSDINTSDDVPALLIEDYNTVGLAGSIDPVEWETASEDAHFGNFWWRHGQSGKSKGKGGRHGIGKGTITQASDINAFIGISHRNCSPHLVGYGQATYWPHRCEAGGPLYDSYGMFGAPHKDFPYPFTGELASDLARKIGFDREGKNGLSLMIPFPKLEVTDEAIKLAVIKKCFYQICSGNLRIEIGDLVIDKDNIAGLAAEHPDTAHLTPIVKLSADTIEPARQFIANRAEKGKSAINNELFSEADIEEIRALWEAGEAVDIAFSVPITKKGGETEWGEGRVILKKHDERETMQEVFVRGRVTVSMGTPKSGNYLGVFSASKDDALSAFLGDSENVAHTEWHKSRVADRYKDHSDTMDRIKNVFKDAYALITGIEADRTIKNALTKFFWKTRVEEKPRNQPKPDEPKPADDSPVISIKADPSPFIVHHTSDCVVITRSERDGDYGAKIEFYYSGKKAREYSKHDFDLSDKEFTLNWDGAIAFDGSPSQNLIELASAEIGSVLRVKGFDPNREVTVRVSPIKKDQ